MKLDFWNPRTCDCAKPDPKLPEPDEQVCRLSPARLLAASLTDPETRGEWKRETSKSAGSSYCATNYRNEARDLTIAKGYSLDLYTMGAILSTPFTLSKAEEQIVERAIEVFDRHERDKREAKAVARLTAPPKAKVRAK